MKLTWRRFWAGDFTKPELMIYLFCVSSFFLGSLIILMAVAGGTFWSTAISNLGNPTIVPNSWWILTIVFEVFAISLIPIMRALPRVIPTTNKWLLFILQGLVGISVIGLISLGFFNETLGNVHIILAVLAFGGMGLALFTSLPILIYVSAIHSPRIHSNRFLILLIVLFSFLCIILNEIRIYGIDTPSDLNFTEWMGTFTLFTYMNLLAWTTNPIEPHMK
jgi:hypothetical protein